MKRTLTILLITFCFSSKAQFFNLTLKKATLDTVKARSTSVYIKDTAKVSEEIYLRDTSIVNLIKKYGGPGSTVSFGNPYEIAITNSLSNDYVYDTDFKYKGDTLYTKYIYANNGGLSYKDSLFEIGGNFKWDSVRLSLKSSIGVDNLFVGDSSGFYIEDVGNYNTFYGVSSGKSNTSGDLNTYIGSYAGYNNTITSRNTFVGSYSGYSNTIGQLNTFVGHESGYSNNNGSRNVLVGNYSGYSNTAGENNVFVGHESGYNNIGDSNIFVGYRAGINESGSNKLYINNTSGTPLIYGEFDNNILEFNSDTTFNKGHLVVDSTLYALHQIQVAVRDCVDITTTGVWLDVKLDTVFENVSTSGFSLNDDSTGIICNFGGTVKMNGKAVLTNNSPGSFNANVKLILYRNSTQVPTISSNVTRSWGSGAATTLIAPAFSFSVEIGDTLYPKGKFGNANVDLDFPDEDISPKFPFILEFFQQPIKK